MTTYAGNRVRSQHYQSHCRLWSNIEALVTLHGPCAAFERAVLDAIGLALELRSDGTVVACFDEARHGMLARALLPVVENALQENSAPNEDEADPAASLARALEEAARRLRERRDAG